MPILEFVATVFIALVFVSIIVYVVVLYNGLIGLKNNIRKSFANIDVLLKQRNDELPKLVATVQGYMVHERTLLENITNARTSYNNAKTIKEKTKSDNVINEALKSLFAVAENYPVLKTNENFLQLQYRITGLENSIADRREFYNDSVNIYNTKIESFPDLILAGMMNLTRKDMFRASNAEKQDVKMTFC